MGNVVIVHGLGVTPLDHWFPSLASAAVAAGHTALVPALPHASEPQVQEWVATLQAETAHLAAPETVLVGHSLGGVALLRLLEAHDAMAEGVFAGVVLVATPAYAVGYAAQAPFFEPVFEWSRIKGAAHRHQVIATADDPVAIPDPFDHVKTLVTSLGATATIRPDGGHLPTTGSELLDLPEATDFALAWLHQQESEPSPVAV
jgi:uncharacterized protein